MRARFFLFGLLFCFAALGRAALPFPESPTCADLATVANRFITLGERKALEEITRLCDGSRVDGGRVEDVREQVGWLCRLLFVRGGKGPIRAPRFGALAFPPDGSALDAWPSYPLIEADGIFFLLARGYVLAGEPEAPEEYLRLCRQEGVFRVQPLRIPTADEGREALKRIVASAAWRRIQWRNWGSNGLGWWWVRSEAGEVAFLESQIRRKG